MVKQQQTWCVVAVYECALSSQYPCSETDTADCFSHGGSPLCCRCCLTLPSMMKGVFDIWPCWQRASHQSIIARKGEVISSCLFTTAGLKAVPCGMAKGLVTCIVLTAGSDMAASSSLAEFAAAVPGGNFADGGGAAAVAERPTPAASAHTSSSSITALRLLPLVLGVLLTMMPHKEESSMLSASCWQAAVASNPSLLLLLLLLVVVSVRAQLASAWL